MGAGAPLLAGITTCAAVHWTLCREAEKHLKENKTSWEGRSAPAQGGWAGRTARPLCTERKNYFSFPAPRNQEEEDVLGDISPLGAAQPLRKGQGNH